MGQDPGPSRPALSGAQEPDRLRSEIEETRQELGETVEALATKTNVKAHTKRKLEETRSSVAEPLPLLTAGAVLTGLVLWQVAAHRRAAQRRRSTLRDRARRLVPGTLH
jgi:hypothetical protein